MKRLKTKMILWIFIFIFPILLILSYALHQITRSYSDQIKISYSQTLLPYVSDIDGILGNAKRLIATTDLSLLFLQETPGSSYHTMELIRDAGNTLSEKLLSSEFIDALFLYDGSRLLFLQNYNISYAKSLRVSRSLKELLQINCLCNDFQSVLIEDQSYFYLYYPADYGIIGCWISADSLLASIHTADLSGVSDIYFSDKKGTRLDASADKASYSYSDGSIFSEPLSNAPFSLTIVWDSDTIHKSMIQAYRIVMFTLTFSVFLFVMYLLFLRHSLFLPLKKLTENIRLLNTKQDWQIPISSSESLELCNVYQALNSMTNEIRQLRIEAYEEKLLYEKTNTELYRLQMKPHFFVNTLNSIQCFTKNGEIKKAEEMTYLLTRHCQYILYNNWLVLLDEELGHVKNYIHLQSILHNRSYSFFWDCPDELLDLEMPILCLQIFVENSIKHAPANAENFYIHIKIRALDFEPEVQCQRAEITILDTGTGLKEEILQKLSSGKKLHQNGELHGIGIDNIRERLRIIYGEKANLFFRNAPGYGACITLLIPMSPINVENEVSDDVSILSGFSKNL